MPKLVISRAYARFKATFTLGTLTCPNRVPWGTKVQTALSKTHVGIFFSVFTVCASAGYEKIKYEEKNGADHAERGFSACVLRAGKKRWDLKS